jgi:CubicO group peptidase (beta-lactamase class C family)
MAMDARTLARLSEFGVGADALGRLRERARREVDEGLLPAAQIALARRGELVWYESFGAATADSLVCIFSATKAVTAAAVWLLLQDGRLRLTDRVADRIPEFATHGKEAVLVEHLLTHTAGFPAAPFAPLDWLDRERRLGRFAQWRLDWEPGSRFEYHPSSTMWVLAELIERCTAGDFRDFLRDAMLRPLGLDELYVGLPAACNDRVLPCAYVGNPLTAADYRRRGLPEPPVTEVTEAAVLNFNKPEVRAVGVPGGGGITNAAALALFYQCLLRRGANGRELWSEDVMRSVRSVHTGALKDPWLNVAALRGLGLVIAGDERRTFRGFGKTQSEQAFGHNGAGGQIAWADPTTGISFVYLTSGHDRDAIRQARRGVALSSLAGTVTGAALRQ